MNFIIGLICILIGLLFIASGIDKVLKEQGKDPLYKVALKIEQTGGHCAISFLYGAVFLLVGIYCTMSYYHG